MRLLLVELPVEHGGLRLDVLERARSRLAWKRLLVGLLRGEHVAQVLHLGGEVRVSFSAFTYSIRADRSAIVLAPRANSARCPARRCRPRGRAPRACYPGAPGTPPTRP